MKYYMLNATDASGIGSTKYSYYALSDDSTLDDATELYCNENPWVHELFDLRFISIEIDEETYRSGLSFNRYVDLCSENDNLNSTRTDRRSYQLWEQHNMFPIKKWAEMFARKNKPVLVGYPKMFSVYKMDENRNLHFIYHYNTGIDFRDDDRLKKSSTKWYKDDHK